MFDYLNPYLYMVECQDFRANMVMWLLCFTTLHKILFFMNTSLQLQCLQHYLGIFFDKSLTSAYIANFPRGIRDANTVEWKQSFEIVQLGTRSWDLVEYKFIRYIYSENTLYNEFSLEIVIQKKYIFFIIVAFEYF